MASGIIGPEDNPAVRFSGVSVRYLSALFRDIVEKKAAPNVQLATVRSVELGCNAVTPGETVQVLQAAGGGGRSVRCRTFAGVQVELRRAALTPKSRKDWSMEDVCQSYVLPMCQADQSFMLDHIESTDRGRRFEGAFLSYARASRFSDVIGSLEERVESLALDQLFVWIDVFSANQPRLSSAKNGVASEIADMLSDGLHEAIALFDETLVFFDSWLNPVSIACFVCFSQSHLGRPTNL
jgi:hypothetical protein